MARELAWPKSVGSCDSQPVGTRTFIYERAPLELAWEAAVKDHDAELSADRDRLKTL